MRWQADSRLGLCGAVLAALTVGGAALHETGRLGIGSEPRRDAFVAVCLVAGGVYLLAVRLVLRMLPTMELLARRHVRARGNVRAAGVNRRHPYPGAIFYECTG